MSYSFVSSKGEKIYVDKLSYSYCCDHSEKILKVINIIPHIYWDITDLLCQDNDFYKNKWNYSYVVRNESREIIGVLISYFRISDKNHIFDSLYLHRYAIDPKYQNIGIGTEVLKYFIQRSFEEIPWLLNISVQTNDTIENCHVINFYRNIGFKDMYNVYYENKTDILLLLERKYYTSHLPTIAYKSNLNLSHPRFNIHIYNGSQINVLPTIYFSSTNTKKKEIVKFIFNNYNVDVSFAKLPVELTEPQIEEPNIEEERKLVSLPLKSVSRFINTVPYVIEDTMLFVEFFNRNGKQWELPGLDTKRWLRQMGLDGFLDIMGNTKFRKAKFVSQTGAYVESNKYFYGRGEIEGTIAYKKSEITVPSYGTYPYFFHLLFIPNGSNKTLAEMDMHEYAQYDYMRQSIVNLLSELSTLKSFERQCTLFDYIKEDE